MPLQNYTQNIDTLETRAGVQKVLQCHGSFATASCINCHTTVPGNAIEADIMNHTIPHCKACAAAAAPLPAPKAKKKGKKRNLAPWESDGEEEPDIPAVPAGIMKVNLVRRHEYVAGLKRVVVAGYHVLWREALGCVRESIARRPTQGRLVDRHRDVAQGISSGRDTQYVLSRFLL